MSGSKVVISAEANQAVREFERFRAQATGSLSAVAAAGSKLNGLLGTIGLTLSAAGFIGMIKGSIDAADNLNDLSKQTRLSIRDLAGLDLAAKQSGSNLAGVADAVSKLAERMGKDSERFKKLGITASDPLEAFKQFADVFAAIEDPQMRAALGAEVLGKSWQEAAPLLAEGGAKIGEMVQRGKDLNPITEEMAAQADMLNDQYAELTAEIDGFKSKLAADALPALNDVTGAIREAYVESGLLDAAFVALGAGFMFAFTDEFDSAQKKLKGMRTDIDSMMDIRRRSEVASNLGVIGEALWGTPQAWDDEIANKKKEIADFIGALQAEQDAATKLAKEKRDKALADAEAEAKRREAERKVEAFLRKQNAELDKEKQLLAQLAGLTGSFAGEWDALSSAYGRGKITLAQLTAAQADLLAKQPAMKASVEAQAKAERQAAAFRSDYAAATKQIYDAYNGAALRAIENATSEAERNERLAATYGMAASAIELAEIARLEEQLAQRASLGLTVDEIENLKLLIDAKKRNAAALGGIEQKDAAKAAAAEWKRAAESINDSLTDALLRGFESGKGFGRNLVDTIKNMFGTLVLRPVISAVMSPVAGVIGGVLGPVAGPVASGALSGGMAGVTGALAGLGVGGLGGSLMAGAGWMAGTTTLGGALGAGASLMGTGTLAGNVAGAGMIAGALLPIALGISLVAKALDKGPEKNTRLTFTSNNRPGNISINERGNEGKWNQAYIDGSSSGAFGSFGLSSTFWMDGRQPAVQNFMKSVTAADNALAQFMTTSERAAVTTAVTGKSFTAHTGAEGADPTKALESVFVGRLNAIMNGVEPGLASLIAGFTGTTDELANEAQALLAYRMELRRSSEAVFGATVTLQQLAAMKKPGESAADAVKRLSAEFTATNLVAASLGRTVTESFGAVGLASAATRARLVELAGGVEVLAQQAQGFAQNYLTEAERLAPLRQRVAAEMAKLGYATVDTRDEFKALVLGLDLTTDAGAKQYAELMKLQEAFAQVTPAMNDAVGGLTSAQTAVADAFRRTEDAAKSAISHYADFADSIRGLIDSTKLGGMSPLTPEQKYAEAKAQYNAIAAAALTGDAAAQARYREAHDAFLSISQTLNASDGRYIADYMVAQANNQLLLSYSQMQISVEQAALEAARAQVEQTIGVKEAVLSLPEAIAQYLGASATQPGAQLPPVPAPAPAPGSSQSNQQSNAALLAELQALRREVAAMRAEQPQHTGTLANAILTGADHTATKINGAARDRVRSQPMQEALD